MRALLWRVFDISVWAQPPTVVAGTTVQGAALDSFGLVGVGSASHCDGGHDWLGHCSGICSPPPSLTLMSCFRNAPESRLVCSLVISNPAASLSYSEETAKGSEPTALVSNLQPQPLLDQVHQNSSQNLQLVSSLQPQPLLDQVH